MKCSLVCFVCFLSVFVAVTNAYPAGIDASASLQVSAPQTASGGGGGGGGGLTSILSNIDLPGLLRGVNSFVKLVGQFCPPLSQVLDNVIQNVTSTAFRVFGRLILQNGGLGGGNAGGGGGQRVNVVLPTFPPDDEDYDEEEEDTETSSAASVASTTTGVNGLSLSSTNTPSTPLYTSAASEDNSIAKRHVRVAREAEQEEEEEEEEDQDGAESAPEPAQDLSDVDVDDQDRNKRFLPFGGTADGHGGSSGGSGNFLFDIIRNTADRAARTVGTVYRMVAGTENLGWGLTATAESSKTLAPSTAPLAKLVAGSGATEAGDEKANSPGGVAEVDVAGKADGYTEGIPGPITRLFVIANRGIANLVQDLILRLAQTSERLVNFKARLVTSLI